ncbi:hypothetical protein FQR65_LT08863 [Abscondita terminalis]|nr:hypothetical protein FQR65_LT08863 [Abscondita terminalis]
MTKLKMGYVPKTVYSVLNPIFYSSKIIGLTPFSLNSTRYKNSKLNKIWCCILLIVYVTIFSCFKEQLHVSAGFITALTAKVDSYCNQFGMWFAIIFAMRFANDLIGAITDLNKLDGELHKTFKVNIKEEHCKSFKNFVIVLVVVLVYSIFYSVNAVFMTTVLDTRSPRVIVDYIIYVGPTLTKTVITLQFSSITWCLKRRFILLNKAIENRFNKFNAFTSTIISDAKIVPSDVMQDKVINVFEDVREKHIQLCMICVKINSCYSFQILMLVLQNFITIILAMYFGGRNLFGHDVISVGFLIYCFNQMFSAIVQIVALVLICSSTVMEARRTGDLIHNSLTFLEPCKKEMYLQASYFSLQLLHNNFDFTASGVLTIDPSLLLEIVGAICTYLVIVVQFEISYPTPNC